MTTSLLTRIKAGIFYKFDAGASFGSAIDQDEGAQLVELANGTAAQQADLVYRSRRTLAASATENLDLAGSLVDVFGNTLTFVKIKAILIRASVDNTNNVVVGGAASNTFVGGFGAAANTYAVPPGGVFLVSAPAGGWTVTAATADILKVANSGGTTGVTYDIVVIGTSA